MKTKKVLMASVICLLCCVGCSKGVNCMCSKYDWDTGHEIGTTYTEQYSNCKNAEYGLASANDYYVICHEVVE